MIPVYVLVRLFGKHISDTIRFKCAGVHLIQKYRNMFILVGRIFRKKYLRSLGKKHFSKERRTSGLRALHYIYTGHTCIK